MTAPAPCPRCGGAMGDGDRVTYGLCAICRRPRPRPAIPRQSLRPARTVHLEEARTP